MIRRSVLLIITLILLAGFASRVSADDGEWGDINTPAEVDWIGDVATLNFDHEDANDWKGWGGMWMKNICGEPWGDFHFQITSIWSWSTENVIFLEDPAPELWVVTGLYTLEQVDLTWQVDNDADGGATMDLFFYDNPIQQGDCVLFKVYTDNTTDHCAWFRITGYPTPVPEPTTVALLGIGGLALLRRRKR